MILLPFSYHNCCRRCLIAIFWILYRSLNLHSVRFTTRYAIRLSRLKVRNLTGSFGESKNTFGSNSISRFDASSYLKFCNSIATPTFICILPIRKAVNEGCKWIMKGEFQQNHIKMRFSKSYWVAIQTYWFNHKLKHTNAITRPIAKRVKWSIRWTLLRQT